MYWRLAFVAGMRLLAAMWLVGWCVDSGEGDHNVQRRSIHKEANIGGSAVMECSIPYTDGQSKAHIISWKKQGIEVPVFIKFDEFDAHIDANFEGRIRRLGEDDATIEISDIRVSDEGWYECSIAYVDGQDETTTNGTWIYLTVNAPPVLGEVSPSFIVQEEGDTVDIFCEAVATPEPTLVWQKNEYDVVPSDRVVMSGNRVQIRNLDKEDGGMYKCTFQNSVGRVSHLIRLVIKDENGPESNGNVYIMRPPKNITVAEGSRVRLNCQAEGDPNNITYHWFRGERDVQGIAGLMSRAGVYADGGLVINNVLKEDDGWYICRPTNGLGEPPEARAYLNITYLPIVLPMPTKIYLPKGMMGRIECPVRSNPPISLVIWRRNDEQVQVHHSNARMMTTKEGTLVIYRVQSEDEGTYTCTPHSPQGAGQKSQPVNVLVRDPPYFTARPKAIYQKVPTDRVEMPCLAQGDPYPTITWHRADGTFPSDTKTLMDGGNMTIINLTKDDYGVYECVASNAVTSVIATSLLVIEVTTPHAPYNVTVDTTEFSARISWVPGFDGGDPQHYVLWYRKVASRADGEDWQTIRVVPDDATSITIYNLESNTEYQFDVLSRNQNGDGYFSNIVTARTKTAETTMDETTGETRQTGAVPGPPKNLTVTKLEKDLVLSYLPPADQPAPTSYTIEYRTLSHWVPLIEGYKNVTYRWKTVSREAKYFFRVVAYNGLMRSIPSNQVSISTEETEGAGFSDGMIGGLVGGLLFFFVAIILATIAVKIFNKRKQREKAMRYGNVKYFGPKQVEANKNHSLSRVSECEVLNAVPQNQFYGKPSLQHAEAML